MFKTIFSKLIIVFISILLVSFTITATILYYFLSDFVLTEKVKLLKQSGEKINDVLKTYADNQENPLNRIFFEQTLGTFSTYTSSLIWVVTKDGYIAFSKPEMPKYLASKFINDSGRLRLPDERQYKPIIEGNKEFIEEKGDFFGMFEGTRAPWLTIEVPFRYKDQNGKESIEGAVYLHTRIPEVQKARTNVFKLFLVSVLISIFISIVLVYIFSLRISRPLKQIKNAAKEIAGGEFQKRLNIKAKDEIGELAVSFNNMAVALQNLEEMRRGFIANVSHELRTPMTSIRGFVDGILDGTIPPERQDKYLTIVREETIRLSRLVTDLLDLAKMEAGEITLSFRVFNITELIRRAIIKLESLIISKNIQIEANFGAEDMPVLADSDAIERVIINLLHNAVKFSNDGGIIKISVEYFKEKLLVTIEDNGIGIDSDEISLIWDRFYKSDKSRGRDKSGTGLGLAIIKSIINEHNQEIWVESELDMGTKFKFTLEKAEKPINLISNK